MHFSKKKFFISKNKIQKNFHKIHDEWKYFTVWFNGDFVEKLECITGFVKPIYGEKMGFVGGWGH